VPPLTTSSKVEADSPSTTEARTAGDGWKVKLTATGSVRDQEDRASTPEHGRTDSKPAGRTRGRAVRSSQTRKTFFINESVHAHRVVSAERR